MRYLPLTTPEREAMLKTIGVRDVDALFKDVPSSVYLDHPVDLPSYKGELEVERTLSAMAAKNIAAGSVPFFCGAGSYRHHVPASVDQLLLRGEFLTAYTPYQPEIAQGTLQMIYEFQTQVALITGMEVANASMYDGATSCVEAIMMAQRITKRKKALLSGRLHPHYREIAETHARFHGFTVSSLDPTPTNSEDFAEQIDSDTACVVVQNPDVFGNLFDHSVLAETCHKHGALLIVVVTEIVSLGLIKSPGEMGADIVAAEGQSIGNSLNFGGPYVGLFATRNKFVRQLPGRLAGETVDVDGRRGWVLTLSTREQHIRREKATSNICTNSGLCALAFSIHMSLLGEVGFQRLAELNHATAVRTADRLAKVPGVKVLNETFFNEFAIRLPKTAADVVEALAKKRILAGIPASRLYPDQPDLTNILLIAATETTTDQDIDALGQGLEEILQ
ncbi:MAG: aminomethyl-transferring glycine dehydrogenase subunit GcvPA [Alphaproteobacteria bacterium]